MYLDKMKEVIVMQFTANKPDFKAIHSKLVWLKENNKPAYPHVVEILFLMTTCNTDEDQAVFLIAISMIAKAAFDEFQNQIEQTKTE